MDNCLAKRLLSLLTVALVTLALSACGSDSDQSNANAPINAGNENAQNDVVDTMDTDSVASDEPPDTTDTDTTSSDTQTPGTNAPVISTPDSSDNNVPQTNYDASGGDDDSPTLTESLSLQGPFVKDNNRSAGPPTVPQGLTALLIGADWVELSWQPAADDQSVEEYEIYRNNELVYSVRGDTNDPDYRSWITTTHIDCNYTRNALCKDSRPAKGSSINLTVVAIDNEGMRSAASTPLSIQLVTPSASGVDLSNYSTIFTEEFDQGILDRNKWKTILPWEDNIINGEGQYLVNIFGDNPPAYDPFKLNGSTLAITAINTPSELLSQSNNQPFLSGVITTADYFEMTYGYVEMSAKLAGNDATLSAFYLFNQDFEKNKPEIDIIEYNGSHPTTANQTYHYFDSNRTRWTSGEGHSSPTMETNTGTNLSDSYHTYSVLWEKELMVWYIDDVEVRRIVGPRVSDEPMNIIAQLVVGSQWVGFPAAGAFNAVMEIDYIRAWQRN